MVREIKARVCHGKIEPLEDIELLEGEEVTILLEDRSGSALNHDRFLRAAGGWEGLLDFDSYLEDLYESHHGRTDDLPKSLFGILKGSMTIKGDIIAPVDVEWDALR